MKKRKLAAPIVISVLVGLWLLGYAVLIFLVPAIPLWIKLLGAVIPLALLGVCLLYTSNEKSAPPAPAGRIACRLSCCRWGRRGPAPRQSH